MVCNKNRKKTISRNYRVCKSLLSKTLGLMFRFKPQTIVFVFENEKKVPLHMFFVFFPIDVLYLNKNKKVVEIKENLMPFSSYAPKNKAMYVVELPSGAVEISRTKLGDIIDF